MFGGDLLSAEVTVTPGRGKLTLTATLADVMQESARAALTYVRSRCLGFGLEPDFHEHADFHIHFPEGAVPKDGPSAGVTIITTLVSALLNIPVRHDVAMTGEITLRGRVMPIGGLKEKVLAAYRSEIKTVICPFENEKDLQDIPKAVLEKVEIKLARTIDDVLRWALVPPAETHPNKAFRDFLAGKEAAPVTDIAAARDYLEQRDRQKKLNETAAAESAAHGPH